MFSIEVIDYNGNEQSSTWSDGIFINHEPSVFSCQFEAEWCCLLVM